MYFCLKLSRDFPSHTEQKPKPSLAYRTLKSSSLLPMPVTSPSSFPVVYAAALASLVFNKLSPQVLCLLLLSPLPRALLAHVCMHLPCSSFRGRNRHSLCPHWADSRVGRGALSSQTNKIRTQSAMSIMVENTCTPTPRENDGAELLNSELRTKERPYKERSFKLGVVCK